MSVSVNPPSRKGREKWEGPARFFTYFYGTTKFTEVPQLAKPSLVPPQVPSARVKADPVQLGYWM